VPRQKKLIPICCEICGNDNKPTLHKHHIVERTNINSNNDNFNLAVICANCHNMVHAGEIKIIGLYPSTKLPYKRTLIFERSGISNVPGITEPYYIPEPKQMRIYEKD
jgi:hypothetical protein